MKISDLKNGDKFIRADGHRQYTFLTYSEGSLRAINRLGQRVSLRAELTDKIRKVEDEKS